MRERYCFEEIGVDGEYNFEMDLKENAAMNLQVP